MSSEHSTALRRASLTGVLVVTITTGAALLTGCSGLSPAAFSGGSSAPASGSASAASPTAQNCDATGSSIPDGHYTGKIDSTIDLAMSVNVNGISIPNAGGGQERWQGTVDLTAKNGQVTGVMSLSELGLSQVGQSGGVQVHSVDNGTLFGQISGPASSPVISATGTGEWASLDAPLGNTSGGASEALTGGLHITKTSCDSISGDVVAMFTDFLAPVAQYLTASGNGAWVATRK